MIKKLLKCFNIELKKVEKSKGPEYSAVDWRRFSDMILEELTKIADRAVVEDERRMSVARLVRCRLAAVRQTQDLQQIVVT